MTTNSEIENIILNLNRKSANGYDNVSTKFLIRYLDYLAHFFCNIINKNILECTFCDCLKIASVTALFKSGSKTEVSNFKIEPVICLHTSG